HGLRRWMLQASPSGKAWRRWVANDRPGAREESLRLTADKTFSASARQLYNQALDAKSQARDRGQLSDEPPAHAPSP
ncbi:MAG: hypothetical protein ACE5R4_18245, partial [Armatimonadota bacterium]